MTTSPTWTAPLTLTSNGLFVFGSNLASQHGAGAARTALKQYSAIYVVRASDCRAVPTATPTYSKPSPPNTLSCSQDLDRK